MHIFSC